MYHSYYDQVFPAVPGEWTIAIEANETAEAWYEISATMNEDAFNDWYFRDMGEKLFMVQNAGIAMQTPFIQEVGDDAVITFGVYDGEGPLEYQELNTIVMYGDPLIQYQDPEGYEDSAQWSGGGIGISDGGPDLYVNSYTEALLIEFEMDLEFDDTVTFTLIEPDGTEHEYEFDFADGGSQEAEIQNPAIGTWDSEIEIDGADTGSGKVWMFVTYDPEPVPMPFWFFSDQTMGRIMSQETIVTDDDGIATLTIPVDETGVYAFFVELPISSDGEYYAAAPGGFLGVDFTIEFDLDRIGTIMGIPVYENPEGIGEELEFDVLLSQEMDAQVQISVAPLDFSEIFDNFDIEYDGDDDELFYDDDDDATANLEVNGPISFLSAFAMAPNEDNIQQYNLNFGFLVTSDTEVQITSEDDLVPGGRYELEITTPDNDPESTYGVVLHEGWIDTNAFDAAYFTSQIFAGMWGVTKELDPDDVADNMMSVVYGEDETGFADIPAHIWEDDFMLLTMTEVEVAGDSTFGVYFGDGEEPIVLPEELTLEVLTSDPVVNGTIEVKVTDEAGDPVEDATVTVTKGGTDFHMLTTDVDGKVSFILNEAGTYHAEATKDDYISDGDGIVVRAEDDPDKRLQFIFPNEERIAKKEFSVAVVDQDTQGVIEGAVVTILSGGAVIKTGFTDALGEVRFVLDEGDYTIRAEMTNYTKDEAQISVDPEKDDEKGVIPGFELIAVVSGLFAALIIGKRKRY